MENLFNLSDLSNSLNQLGYHCTKELTDKNREYLLTTKAVSLEHQKQLRKQYKDNNQMLLFSPRRDGRTAAVIIGGTHF